MTNFINVDCSGGRAASCSEVSLPVFSSLFVTLLLFITFKTLFSYRMYVHASFRVAAVVGRHLSFGLAGRRVCCSVAARLFLCQFDSDQVMARAGTFFSYLRGVFRLLSSSSREQCHPAPSVSVRFRPVGYGSSPPAVFFSRGRYLSPPGVVQQSDLPFFSDARFVAASVWSAG